MAGTTAAAGAVALLSAHLCRRSLCILRTVFTGKGSAVLWRAVLQPRKTKKKLNQKLLRFSVKYLNSTESSFLLSSDHVVHARSLGS